MLIYCLTHFDPQIAEAVVRLHERGALLPPEWDAYTASTTTQEIR